MAEGDVASIGGFVAGYVEVAGLRTWHEVRGEGTPGRSAARGVLRGGGLVVEYERAQNLCVMMRYP